MTAILFIHGLNSSGNSNKAQKLQHMFPQHTVLAPTFNYNTTLPEDIQSSLRKIVADNDVQMIVGSSFGGYHALCTLNWFKGTVWCINPATKVLLCICVMQLKSLFCRNHNTFDPLTIQQYKDFDKKYFQPLKHNADKHPNFALSTDDHTLKSRIFVPKMFPHHGTVVWKDNCGHHFSRFDELKQEFEKSLP